MPDSLIGKDGEGGGEGKKGREESDRVRDSDED